MAASSRLIDGLAEEVDGARLHGLHAGRDVRASADENDGEGVAAALQRLLQLEAGHAGHAQMSRARALQTAGSSSTRKTTP
jgi:hypothetical protein